MSVLNGITRKVWSVQALDKNFENCEGDAPGQLPPGPRGGVLLAGTPGWRCWSLPSTPQTFNHPGWLLSNSSGSLEGCQYPRLLVSLRLNSVSVSKGILKPLISGCVIKILPRWCSGEEPTCQHRRPTFAIPGSRRSPGEENGNPFQYSCLEIPWTEEPDRLQSMGSQRVGRG